MPETLGDFMKKLRTELYVQRTGQGKLTQEQLGAKVGYERRRVNLWERNRRIPTPDILLKIAEVTYASFEDINHLLGLAGYLPPTRFPPREHTLKVLKKVADYLAYMPYPAYLLDYRGRFWIVNEAVSDMVGLELNLLRSLMQNYLSNPIDYLQIIFNSRLPFKGLLSNHDRVARGQIARFKARNIYRRHEKFYQNYLEEIKQHLPPEDYAYFAMLWQEIDSQYMPDDGDLFATQIVFERNGIQQAYNIHFEGVFQLHNLFEYVQYWLQGSEPRQTLTNPQEVLRLWDLIDVTPFF